MPSSNLRHLPGLWPILEKCWQKDPTKRVDSRKCLESLTLKTTAVYLEPAELLFGRGGDAQKVVTTIYNIQDRPLVFWFQFRASSNSSRYDFSPVCGVLPPRTRMAVKVAKLKKTKTETDLSHTVEDKLRLRYSFMEKIEAGETPISMWNKQVTKAPSAFWDHESIAGVGPRYRTGLTNVRLKAACVPPQIPLPSAPRLGS
ncbi:hypothetical protein FRB95_008169 [Tulasnella sp. JGI-2019a]|nr:hypothetical protein FRB95_008169 [Tulasnella sp. JGI-2019a]